MPHANRKLIPPLTLTILVGRSTDVQKCTQQQFWLIEKFCQSFNFQNLDLKKSHPTFHIATLYTSFVKFIAFLVPFYLAHSLKIGTFVQIHRGTLLLNSFALNLTQPLAASVKSAIFAISKKLTHILARMVVMRRFRQR